MKPRPVESGYLAKAQELEQRIDNLLKGEDCPKCKGGKDVTANVVPSCRRCNQEKGSRNWLDWMRATFGYNPDREHVILSHIN